MREKGIGILSALLLITTYESASAEEGGIMSKPALSADETCLAQDGVSDCALNVLQAKYKAARHEIQPAKEVSEHRGSNEQGQRTTAASKASSSSLEHLTKYTYKFSNDSSLPRVVKMTPLFPEGIASALNALHVKASIPRSSGTNGVILVNYHKTGEFFLTRILKVLPPLFGATLTEDYEPKFERMFGSDFHNTSAYRGYVGSGVSALSNGDWARVRGPSATLPLQKDVRTVYFFRDPVDLILSAYRYHSAEPMREPRWQSTPNQCHNCDATASNALFRVCNFNCTYLELLRGLNETGGCLAEAYQSRKQLEHMVGNLVKWANDPNVLFLSLEHLGTDYERTMQCMLDFLAFSGDTQTAMTKLAKFDIHNDSANLENMTHVTEGKYDNKKIQSLLESHTSWVPQFKQIGRNLLSIYLRQKKMYGCPVPDLLNDDN